MAEKKNCFLFSCCQTGLAIKKFHYEFILRYFRDFSDVFFQLRIVNRYIERSMSSFVSALMDALKLRTPIKLLSDVNPRTIWEYYFSV